jgi:hypothetical protein
MDKLRDDIVAKIKGNQIKQIQIHGVVRKDHGWYLIDSSMLKVKLGHRQMVDEGIFADRWD